MTQTTKMKPNQPLQKEKCNPYCAPCTFTKSCRKGKSMSCRCSEPQPQEVDDVIPECKNPDYQDRTIRLCIRCGLDTRFCSKCAIDHHINLPQARGGGMKKTLDDFQPVYNCRFHPTDWWHEVGCSHQEWTKKELQDALNKAKQSNAYLVHCMAHLEDLVSHPKKEEVGG